MKPGDATPRSLASEDMNADGFPDLVVGYSGSSGGMLALHLGDAEAFAPTQPETIEGIRQSRFREPFQPGARVLWTPDAPDFLAVGDFNRDGKRDILTAAKGASVMHLLAGNDERGFDAPAEIALSGSLTALAATQANDQDGGISLAVAVNGENGASVLVYAEKESLLEQKPRAHGLPAAATMLAPGRLDGDRATDLAVIAGQRLYVLHGQARQALNELYGVSPDPQAGRLEAIALPFTVNTVAISDFIWDRDAQMELAIAGADGSVRVLSRGALDTRPFTEQEMRINRQRMMDVREGKLSAAELNQPKANATWTISETTSLKLSSADESAQPLLMSTLVSGQRSYDLLAVNPAGKQVQIGYRENGRETRQAVAFDTDGDLVAALPMRLNVMGRPGIVLLGKGQVAPIYLMMAPLATYDVDRTDDNAAAQTCNNGANNCSLRGAIIKANTTAGADIITFSTPNGTPFTLTLTGDENLAATGDLDINDDLTITGNGAANTIIQGSTSAAFAGNMGDKAFGINQSGNFTTLNVTMSGLTVRWTRNDLTVNGNFTDTGGAMDIFLTGNGATPGPTTTLTNVTFDSNASLHSYGGAINIDSGAVGTGIHRGTVQMTSCTISNNDTLTTTVAGTDRAPHGGGLNLFADKHNVTFTNCSITGNQTSNLITANAGGINMRHSNGGTITLSNTSVNNNTAGSDGGGILIAGVGFETVNMTGGSITGNTALGTGDSAAAGGFFNSTNIGGSTTLSGVLISNNIATAGANGTGGGIVDSANEPITITNCTISGNQADFGGGVATTATGTNQTTTITGSTITGNTAGTGAGLLNSAGIMIVNTSVANPTSTISGNTASVSGGGIAVTGATASLTVSNTTISSNSATTSGGALFISAGTMNVSLSRMVSNTAGSGTGIVRTGGTATVENNWWGCDGFPSDAGCQTGSGTFDADPRIDLRLTASPTSVLLGGTSSLTADVTKNTNGANTNGGNAPSVLVGLNLTFASGPKGTINAPLVVAIPAGGTVAKTFTAGTVSASCGAAMPSVTLDNGTQAATIQVQCPDLVGTKANNVSNAAVVGQTWTWTITVTNQGDASGTAASSNTFQTGNTILTDNLPNSANISYGSPTSSIAGVSCIINGTKDLTCTATSPITLAASGGNFNVQFTAIASPPGTAVGTYTNPRAGGAATVDPNDSVVESNEANNAIPANSVVVSKANTTTTITNAAALATATVVGQPYAVDASVAVTAPGTGTPTGTITVSDGSQTCTITLPATSCNLTSTTAGAKTVTATYNGDTNYNTSMSSGVSHTVNKANTTTTITNAAALATATVVGESYAVNWSVTVNAPGAVGAALTGNVTVDAGGGNTCTAAVSAGTCNIVSTTAGAKTITAAYAGDTNYNGSTSTPATPHTVNPANTTTTITNAASLGSTPTVVGQAYAVTWSVTVNAPGAVGAALTGNVTVSDGSQSCTAAVSAGTCNLTSTTAGAKTITATYAGDANYNGSTSAGAAHTVNPANTTTTITNAASLGSTPTVVGQSYAVNWSVTVNAPGMLGAALTGNVTVSDGTGATCVAAVSAGTCNLVGITAGAKTITAAYAGDANYTGSTSAGASHTVNKANTTAAITADPTDPSVVGQPYAITAIVNVTAPGAATPTAPTGTITVSDGSQTCTITLPATSCNLTSTTAGAKSLTATYNGDANFNASPSSAVEPHTVNKADTTTTITADTPDPSNPGASVTVNFTVVPVSPGAGTPTGNVTVTVSGGAETCTGTVAAGSCNITLTVPGTRTLTATYAGDANFNTSSDTESHQVATPPTISKSFTPNQIKVNETSLMSFSITNPNASLALSNISFSDTFPAGIEVDLSVTPVNNCGGSFSPALVNGATSFNYVGGTLAAGAPPCTISITVKATTAGVKNNTTGVISATETGAGATSNQATLTVVGAPVLAKSFTPGTVVVGQTSSLGYTITNNNTTVALTGIAFTDTLPAGMTVATGTSSTCGGTLTTTAPNTVSFSGGTLAAGSPSPTTCAFSVNVTPTMAGALVNVTGAITSVESGPGATATATLTVNKANTTTAITADTPDPSVVGQPYAVTAVVTVNSPGSGTPTGTITVTDGTSNCTITLPATSCNLTSTTAGAKTLVATYNGDTNFNTSVSAGVPHTVNKADTSLTALTDTPDPSVVGQAYTVGFTLNVTAPGGGTPTGTVTVSDGTGGTCTATLPATSCLLTSTTAGAKTLTFTYNGDANFNTSTNTTPHTVNKADTTATITADTPDPSVVGQNYAVTASVAANSPGSGTPTGTITVSDGTNTCTITLPATSCNLPSTSVGAKTLTATYNGDANFNASPASAGVPHTVNKADTTTTITADTPDPSVVGQNYAVTANVAVNSPGSGTPTGTITVTDGTNNCTITLPATSCNLPSTSAGAKTLTATYNGDANFNASPASAGVPHTVNKADTSLSALTDSPDPTVVGQAYTVGFTLNVTAPGAGTPTGTVTVSDGTGGTCTATLPATSCSLTSTTAGAKTLTFTYNGDANFNTSTNTTAHTVNKGNTTTTITADTPDPSVAGQAYLVTVSLAVNAPAVGTPTGTITVSDGTGSTCTITLPGTSCNLTSTTVGAKTLVATYNGDANFNTSTSAGVAHQVNCPTIDMTPKPSGPFGTAAYALATGTVGANYTAANVVITPTPAGGNYSFMVIAAPNTLPPGLSLSPTANNVQIIGTPTTAGTYVFRMQATGFGTCIGSRLYSIKINASLKADSVARVVRNDFDGDGKSDLARWLAQEGEWQVVYSSDSELHRIAMVEPSRSSEKQEEYLPAAADFDGDRRTDAAVWRPRDGHWLIQRSTDGEWMKEQFGLAGDTPMPADFDGDGRADVAVWRGGTDGLHVRRSSDQTEQAIYLGQAGDVPVLGDYDGDGWMDVAVFRANEGLWQVRATATGVIRDERFGRWGDVPCVADYDGDGKDDLAVWRSIEGAAYVRRSADEATQRLAWGRLQLDEWMVLGDYDGDGRAEPAIWRSLRTIWDVLFN